METGTQTDVLNNQKETGVDPLEKVVVGEKVSKSFDSNHVLKEIDFHLSQNENLVIMGRSGSGKSVLMKCLVGLVIPDSGKLEVLGKDIKLLDDDELNELRREVGYLFQGGALYDAMTVRQNLEFPLKRLPDKPAKGEITDKVEEVLNSVGLIEAIDKMPSELSGGMKKRIALARTIILKPKIILYDEPTTGLDTITAKEISNLIRKMQSEYGISSLTITHDLLCTKITGDRICILKNGNFLAEGTYEELRNSDKEKISAFFEQS